MLLCTLGLVVSEKDEVSGGECGRIIETDV